MAPRGPWYRGSIFGINWAFMTVMALSVLALQFKLWSLVSICSTDNGKLAQFLAAASAITVRAILLPCGRAGQVSCLTIMGSAKAGTVILMVPNNVNAVKSSGKLETLFFTWAFFKRAFIALFHYLWGKGVFVM